MSKPLWFIGGAAATLVGIFAYKKYRERQSDGEASETGELGTGLMSFTPQSEQDQTLRTYYLNRGLATQTAY